MNVYRNDEDRRRFLRLLGRSASHADVDVVAYCLLGNHYHLVVHCPAGGLSTMMWRLGAEYARTFNVRHGRDGPLFKSRFTSVAIESDEQLTATLRYVHRNPIDFGQRPIEWPWSSYGSYLGAEDPPSWLRTSMALQIAGGAAKHRRDVDADWPTDCIEAEPIEPADLHHRWQLTAMNQWLARIDEALANSEMPSDSHLDARLLLALDSRKFTSAELAGPLGFASSGALRTRAARVRSRIDVSDVVAAHVRNL